MKETTFNGTPLYKLFTNLPRMNEVANKKKHRNIQGIWYTLF